MNCANHPESPVAAYCQNCGKALCSNCVRAVAGVIYCEQCLAARLGIGAAPGGPAAGVQPNQPSGVVAPAGPNPGLAFALGFIPGVGAFYNGQFLKGLVHVLVFVILVSITDSHPIFSIFVFAWVAYQIFDAYQTAKARREGLPLPDPFGLNDLGSKLGIQSAGDAHRAFHEGWSSVESWFDPQKRPPAPGAGAGMPPPPAAGFAPTAGFTDPYAQPYSGVPPVPPVPGVDPMVPPPFPRRRHEPVGALVLIGLGVLFLLNTLDVFHFDWIGRLWPVLIIGFGALLLIRKTRETPPSPPTSGGGQ
jgi:TM2 domain-containing membrane protein YozV